MTNGTGSTLGRNALAVLGVVVLVVVVSFLFYVISERRGMQGNGPSQSDESVFQDIVARGSIRCGYVSNPPSCMKDPNTGELSGIFVEAIEAAGEKLGLKIEWTEEVGWGSMIEGIKAGRYDIVPSAIWPNSKRSRHVHFTRPLFYSGVCAYVRADDSRFDSGTANMNSPSVKIATMDGEMAEVIANTDFPKAQKLQVPQLSEITSMLLNVKDGKADVTFVELFFATEFLKNNPGALKNVTPNAPLRVFPNTVMIPLGEYELEQMLNTALEELLSVGLVDRLIDKYEPEPGTFYRLRTPYAADTM